MELIMSIIALFAMIIFIKFVAFLSNDWDKTKDWKGWVV